MKVFKILSFIFKAWVFLILSIITMLFIGLAWDNPNMFKIGARNKLDTYYDSS